MIEGSVIKLALNSSEYKGMGNKGLLLIHILLDNHQPSNKIVIDRRYVNILNVWILFQYHFLDVTKFGGNMV